MGVVSDHQREQALTGERPLTVPQFVADGGPESPAEAVSVKKPGKPRPGGRSESKAARQERLERVKSAVLAAEHLKAGEAPPKEQLEKADPETLAAEVRQLLVKVNRKREAGHRTGGIGRPCEYSEDEVIELLEWVQDGKSLRAWCEQSGRAIGTIYRWMQERPSFKEAYARAVEDRADTLVDELIDIADGRMVTLEDIKAAELRINTRKWCAERMRPQKWALQTERQPAQQITFNISTGRRIAESQPLTIEQGQSGQLTVAQPALIASSEPSSD